jgi:RND family efflux transporter MFP subunit
LAWAVCLLPLVCCAAGCGRGAPARRPKTPEVKVTTPVTGEVADYQDFTGRLSAIKAVDIRARVSGYVDVALGTKDLPLKEGDLVHKGDLLFKIDPRTYLADYNLAKANVGLAEADRNLQKKNAERARDLFNRKAMSQEDYETIAATYAKSIETVKSMKAARDKAKLYLDFTNVTAPLDGRISRRYVDPGNLVTADNTILTSIVTEGQMYAYFDVDERTYLELLASFLGRMSWLSGELQFPVLMRLTGEDEFTHAGYVNFLDNQVNPTTGTIRMRGLFENFEYVIKDKIDPKTKKPVLDDKTNLRVRVVEYLPVKHGGVLKPGLFARIRLPLGEPYKPLLIPDEALQSDQGRKYVFVVRDQIDPKTKKPVIDPETSKPVQIVEYRAVTLGQAIDGRRVIKEGLSRDDRVIISGMQLVRQGMKVKAIRKEPSRAPVSPLVELLKGKQLPREFDKVAK